MTDFLEATSLPVNVPIHRTREASQPSTPMREEFERCANQLPQSLACKLLLAGGEDTEGEGWVSDGEDWGSERGRRMSRKKKKRTSQNLDLIFAMEI